MDWDDFSYSFLCVNNVHNIRKYPALLQVLTYVVKLPAIRRKYNRKLEKSVNQYRAEKQFVELRFIKDIVTLKRTGRFV
jgi:hypothetical protein